MSFELFRVPRRRVWQWAWHAAWPGSRIRSWLRKEKRRTGCRQQKQCTPDFRFPMRMRTSFFSRTGMFCFLLSRRDISNTHTHSPREIPPWQLIHFFGNRKHGCGELSDILRILQYKQRSTVTAPVAMSTAAFLRTLVAGWLLQGIVAAANYEPFAPAETGAILSPRFYHASPAEPVPLVKRQSQCRQGSHPCA